MSDSATPRTVAHQVPLSMGFSRQEYCIGLPCPSPGHLPSPGTGPTSLTSPALAGGFFTTSGHLGWGPHLVCCVTESLGVACAKASIPGPSEQGFPWILGLWFPGGPSGFLFSDTCRNPHGSTALLRLLPWAGLGWTPAPHLSGTTPCDCAATMTTGQNECAQPQSYGELHSPRKGIGPGRGPGEEMERRPRL